MFYLLLMLNLAFILGFTCASAQIKVTIKEVVNHVGKEITLCDTVYSTRALDSLSLLNLRGKFPNEMLSVVVFKADRAKFEKEPVDLFKHKSIFVTRTIKIYKEKLRIVVIDPKQIRFN